MGMDEEAWAIINEFARDVRVVGEYTVAKEWPDLYLTYNRAKLLLKKEAARKKAGKLD